MTADRCAACNGLLPGRSPNSPDARYCQEHWWAEQERLWLAGEPAHPLTWRILERRHGPQKRSA